MMQPFSYVKAKSVTDAIEHLGRAGARPHAGGTDLLGCLRDEALEAKIVVSLSGLKELRGIERTADGGLRIGALATIEEIAGHPLVRGGYTALARAASVVASPQLREQGTLGGNLCQRPRCWYFRGDFLCAKKGGGQCFAVDGENAFHAILGGGPCHIVHPSDTAPALIALGARVRLAGPEGERTLPLEELFALPDRDVTRETVLRTDQLLIEVLLPPPVPGLRSTYRKVRARQAWDFALASAAIALGLDEGLVASAAIVLGGVAPVPWRVDAAEEALVGRPLEPATIEEATAAAVAGAEPLEQNAYKVELVNGILRSELTALAKDQVT